MTETLRSKNRTRALTIAAGFLFSASFAASATSPLYGRPDPSNPRYADFDYLRGEWEASITLINRDGSRQPLENKSKITAFYHADGQTVQSCFRATDFFSTSIRAYDLSNDNWKAHFLNARLGRWSGFTVKKVGETRETIVPGGYSGKENFDVRAVEYDIKADSYRADIFRRAKGAEEWVQTYEMQYRRLANNPDGPKC